jgi:chemotaxis protein MotB
VGYRKGYGSGQSPIASGSTLASSRTPLKAIVRSTEQRTFEQARTAILERIAANDSLRRLNAIVDVQVTADGLRIELVESGTGDVYFPSGSARMKPTTMLVLQLVGAELARLRHDVVLEGHTDAARFGRNGDYGNWELSADRANAARRVLEGVGVAPERVTEVRGYADTRPRVPDDPLAAANRRISILLPFTRVPEGSGNPAEMAASKRDSMVETIGRPDLKPLPDAR